jgi:hypothetical protein
MDDLSELNRDDLPNQGLGRPNLPHRLRS